MLVLLFGYFQASIPFEAFSQSWLCGSSFTDTRDSAVYNTVLIGNQCWIQKNLNYGRRINGNLNQLDKKNAEKYCYNDLVSNCNLYGGLYQWGQMVQFFNGASDTTSWGSGPSGNIQGLCPSGWLLPTDQNWCSLTSYIDSTVNCETLGFTGKEVGVELKVSGTAYWSKPNYANNTSQFSGLPAGNRSINGTFSGLYNQDGFWTMSEYSSNTGYGWGLVHNDSSINRNSINKATGLSIRCFKNCTTPSCTTPCTNEPGPTKIQWYWSKVMGAMGYRWAKINNFDSAIDVGSSTSYLESGLNCNTFYNSYVWVYNDCNHSNSTRLSQTTTSDSPVAPIAGNNIPALTKIIWNWHPVNGATGYLWSTTNDTSTAINVGTDTSKGETGLSPSTIYKRYVWAYNGICGNSIPTPLIQTTSTFICHDSISYSGQSYGTILIGNQCWMKQNLNVGKQINSSHDQTNNDTIEKYCYQDIPSKCDTFGGYYQWGEIVKYAHGASDTSVGNLPDTVRGICPPGWRIPTNDDWCILMRLEDDSVIDCDTDGTSGSDAGIKLRVNDIRYWKTSSCPGNNNSHFTALGGGLRSWDIIGGWGGIRAVESYWSLTQYCSGAAAIWGVWYSSGVVDINPSVAKTDSHPIRCMMDCTPTSAPSPGNNIPHPTWIIWNWHTVTGAVGYRWSSTNNYDSAIDVGSVTSYAQTSLLCNTAYTSYVWAYNACSIPSLVTTLNQSTLSCPPCGDTIIFGGQSYSTVLIDNQCWMKQNLNVGKQIDSTKAQTNNDTIEKYCYRDLVSNCNVYGGLYQWGEAVNYYHGATDTTSWDTVPIDFIQGICPQGWHIPSIYEFSTLVNYLGGGDSAGYYLKETDTIHWLPQNPANNSSNFTALGAGIYADANFGNLKQYGFFWTVTEYNKYLAWDPNAQSNTTAFPFVYNTKVHGFPVRCIRDY